MAVTWPSAVTTEYDADDADKFTSNAQALRDRGEVMREAPFTVRFSASTSHTEPWEPLSSQIGGTLHVLAANNAAVIGTARMILQDAAGADLVVGATAAHIGADPYVEMTVALTSSLILIELAGFPNSGEFGHGATERLILEFERVSGAGNYTGQGLNAWVE